LTRVCDINADGIALFVYPVILALEPVAVHVKRVPATLEVRMILVFVLLHCDFDNGRLERSGVGYTVTT
jgi:hypothetical protein